jgi:hypothetical protein
VILDLGFSTVVVWYVEGREGAKRTLAIRFAYIFCEAIVVNWGDCLIPPLSPIPLPIQPAYWSPCCLYTVYTRI